MRRLLSVKAAAIAALMLALAACNKAERPERELFATVPADADVIVSVDLGNWLKNAGCRSDRGSISLTPAIDKLLERGASGELAAVIAEAAAAGRYVDIDKAVIISDSRMGGLCLSAPLRPDQPLPRLENDCTECELSTVGDAVVWTTPDSLTVIATKSQYWLVADRIQRAVVDVDSLVERADRLSVAADARLCDFLTPDSAATALSQMRAVLNVGPVANPIGSDFSRVLVEGSLAKRSLTFDVVCTDAAGEPVDVFSNLIGIDPAAREYMPVQTALSISAGLRRETLRDILAAVGKNMSLKSRIALELLGGVLGDAQGTVMAAFSPGGNAETIRRFSSDTWMAKALLPVDPDRYDAIAAAVRELSGNKLYCDMSGDFLAVTNYDPLMYDDDGFEVPEPAPEASASVLEAELLVPYRSELMKALRLPCGVGVVVHCADCRLSARINVLGDVSYILPSLVDIANIILRK